MTRYAEITQGVVTGLPEATPAFAATMGWIHSDTAEMGDLYDKATGKFSRPPPPPPPVPASVNQRQARRALRAAGKLQAVEDAMQAMPGEEGEDARIDWERAPSIERASPLVAAMGAMLGMDDDALDDLFRQAAAL